MEFRKKGDLWVTNFGDDLLSRHPNFVRDFWLKNNQEPFFIKDKDRSCERRFTEIIGPDKKIYVEKQGEDGKQQLQRLKVMEQILQKEGLAEIVRIVTPYFAKEYSILLEKIYDLIDLRQMISNCTDDEAFAIWKLGKPRNDFPKEFGRDEEGKLLIYDPHCPTDRKYL